MANINEIISEVAKLNPELARQIQKYVKDHSYGLVFERNLPEAIRLYKKEPIPGDTVNILPKRGNEEADENKIPWVVKAIKEGKATLEYDVEIKEVEIEDIAVLVSYRDVIYPGLKEIDRVERGNPDDPYHMVINSENYHALEALTYAYAGKVDCIYIDPPYNNRNRSWKYNNNYVSDDDQYKHSKWLAFMERRLKLAKQLLNPKDSVLIVTIDEKEYARLALLLEQIFPEANIQMITSVISAKGVVRAGQFSRVEEYIFILQFGIATVQQQLVNMLDEKVKKEADREIEWLGFRRRAPQAKRLSRPNQFYPVYVNNDDGTIHEIGDVVKAGIDRNTVFVPEGCTALWPLSKDGDERLWSLIPEQARTSWKKGYLRIKNWNKDNKTGTVYYLASGTIEDIENGKATIIGKNTDGSIIAKYIEKGTTPPKRVWNMRTHNAETYGTNILNSMIGTRFDYPKSLYAVHDVLKFYLENHTNALVVDFFAGSGTTLHAVNLLNAEDGGKRRCVCITNNEVSEEEEKKYTEKGLRPSDPEWEKYGIANYVTWPRTVCSIEGHDVNGKPLTGNYGKPSKDIDLGYDMPISDGFKANAVFCELTYESAWPIRLDRAFDAIAPILWMQAGCQGPIIKRIGKSYLTTDFYGVLFDYGQASKFCEKVKKTQSIKTVFVVTDDQRRYSNMCKRLPGVEVHRLYETFLRTFEICGEGGLD
ncbi:site-specific DNA-methyltransferase [Cellulosilyticum sp. I15G10I2]|uniref:site-specific DNA-methyltransferase n=1 Tax=Cellulosilyticum sp. I15G10I2 TaxID=1892843 RepID=UPI00085CD4DB|nr:DNA methyltransferase [Cellulosilyticum sp. I15G10I2]